jgi:hypothetical protein
VEYYSYRYKNRFPDEDDIVRFNYSGNWIFRLTDKEEKNTYGEGRFLVVDDVSRPIVTVRNGYFTDAEPPLNQIHRVQATVPLPREIEGYYYTAVDVYQNRRLFDPRRVDLNDRDPYTKVEGFNLGFRIFTALNIHPGNEYRTLNIGNVAQYPQKSIVRLIGGVDQPRTYWRTGADMDGTARLDAFTGIASDYLQVLFRLDLTLLNSRNGLPGGADVFVVGPFNQWNPGPDDMLVYDQLEQCFTVKKLLRRGVYDYQYVIGIWNAATSSVAQQDWIMLEGNDWRSTHDYHAVVYYDDPRFGGFDRIVGFGFGRSPGTASAN